MDWNANLPDVDSWQPSAEKRETLRSALMLTCQIAQTRIVSRADDEIRFNLHNFDSGLGVEDIVREELGALLPGRYFASSGVISDARGHTAGECDLVVRDHIWSPVIKPQATSTSRRVVLPIESIYAVTEVKQSLGFTQLDAEMKKLVTISRLARSDNPYGHITENQHLEPLDQQGKILNPLHTTVLATRLQAATKFEDIVRRFGAINSRLRRDEMVTMLCVLGRGTAWYSVESGEPMNATYMWDREQPLILQMDHREPENAFYRYIILLMEHLTRSVLGLNEVWHAYGEPPPTRDTFVYPDAEFNRNATA